MRVTKKKVNSLCLVVALLAVAVIGGTLAYFTDTEEATNTFTFDNKVDLELTETDNEGNEFEQDQKLLPGSSTENAIAKVVTVTVEEDSEDAWVWVEVLIPAPLYNSKTETNENNNALHYNQFINYLTGYSTDSSNANAKKCAETYESDHAWNLMKYIEDVTIDGVKYSKLRTTHKDPVAAGETTSPALNQVYMDDDVYVDNETGKYMIPKDGKSAGHATEFVPYEGEWEVVVNAYAMQAAGIDSVDAAVAAYAAQGK